MAASDLSDGGAGVPWLAAVSRDLPAFADDLRNGRWHDCLGRLCETAAARGLTNENGLPLRFVDSSTVDALAYEQHIWLTGCVPTRLEGAGAWHDFLNATLWLALPRVKARLNRLQASAIARDGVRDRRGALRDAATLFDENAVVVLAADPEVARRLREHDWCRLFVHDRAAFDAGVRVIGFGHALLDKLRAPYKGVCAHAWVIAGDEAARVVASIPDPLHPEAALPAIDALVVRTLDESSLVPQGFTPLPVLGVPGWWPDNANPVFYDDRTVFRPPRAPRRASDLTPVRASSRAPGHHPMQPEGVSP